MNVTREQLRAFRATVRALDAGDQNAFGRWHFATLVAFGAAQDCHHVSDRIWRALMRCSPNAEQFMYRRKRWYRTDTENRFRADERAQVRTGWTYGRRRWL